MKKLLLLLSVVLGLSANAQTDTTITTFENFPAMEDNTPFTFDAEAVVTYQNGKYLFVRSIKPVEEYGRTQYYSYPALLYGNAGQTYTNGDGVPAGWNGTKTTYKGMPEAKISGLEATTGKVDNATVLAAPIDYSGYMDKVCNEEYYNALAGEYMTFGPVYISDVDGNAFTISETVYDYWDTGDYVTHTMPGYNMFYKTVSLPTDLDKPYTITGIYYIYNGAMQFVPTSIEIYIEPRDLYNVWASGKEDSQYRITDELYVVAPTMAQEPEEDSENYIYITDNKWEYEYYGYIFDWLPTYMAIDCQGDNELYNQIASMNTIKAGALVATLANLYTNPRLLVTTAPEASENTTQWKYTEMDLNTDTLRTYGHKIISLTAIYDILPDGTEILRGYDDYHGSSWQPFVFDRRYIGNVALQKGHQYHFNRVVIKQVNPWNSEEPIQDMKAPAAPQEFKIKALNEPKAAASKANGPRRMNPFDPHYYDNMFLCPLDAEGIQATGIDEVVDANKQVSKVEYVNVAGQTSDVPFDGVNIMVTRYTDGSSVATKVVK